MRTPLGVSRKIWQLRKLSRARQMPTEGRLSIDSAVLTVCPTLPVYPRQRTSGQGWHSPLWAKQATLHARPNKKRPPIHVRLQNRQPWSNLSGKGSFLLAKFRAPRPLLSGGKIGFIRACWTFVCTYFEPRSHRRISGGLFNCSLPFRNLAHVRTADQRKPSWEVKLSGELTR
jgi:hypothetical protein